MNHYPITIGSDTGTLKEDLQKLATKSPFGLAISGGAAGALIGSLFGHTKLGAVVGAGAGYLVFGAAGG